MSTELATVEEGQMKVWTGPVPDALKRGRGMENLDSDDIAIPRLLLAQSGSPAAKKSSEKYIEGLSEGDFYNSISRRIYGPSVRVIPIAFTKNRMLYIDNQIDCRSENGIDGGHHAAVCEDCEYAKWGTGKDGHGTACTLFKNYVCYIVEDKKYALFSFKRGSLEVAKEFNAAITGQSRVYKDADGKEQTFDLEIYGCEYMLTASPKTKGDYSWYALGFKYVRDVVDNKLLTEFNRQQRFFLSSQPLGSESGA